MLIQEKKNPHQTKFTFSAHLKRNFNNSLTVACLSVQDLFGFSFAGTEDMTAVALGLLVMLMGATHAMATSCDATQAASQCSVAPGEAVYIQFMSNASGYELRLAHHLSSGPTPVFSMKRNTVNIQGAIKDRSVFFVNNGTLLLTNVTRNDAGLYIFVQFNTDGVNLEDKKLQLIVEERSFLQRLSMETVIVCGSSAGLVLVLTVLVVVCCTRKRKRKQQEPDLGKELERTTLNIKEEEGNTLTTHEISVAP